MRGPIAALAAALLLVAACSPDGSTGTPAITAADAEEARLAAARDRWDATGLDAYEWTFTRYCLCPPLSVSVRVVDGAVAERTVLEGFQEQTDFDFLTMDELHGLVATEIEDADEVEVEYDPVSGAVIRARFDRVVDAVDDELEYRVDTLVPTGGGPPVLTEVAFTRSWPCGRSLQASDLAQTVGIELRWEGEPQSLPTTVELPDPDWGAEVVRGQHLFANWCDDVLEPHEPTRAVDRRLPIVAGHLEIEGPTEGDRTVSASATGLAVERGDGSTVELPAVTIVNTNWGGAAG